MCQNVCVHRKWWRKRYLHPGWVILLSPYQFTFYNLPAGSCDQLWELLPLEQGHTWRSKVNKDGWNEMTVPKKYGINFLVALSLTRISEKLCWYAICAWEVTCSGFLDAIAIRTTVSSKINWTSQFRHWIFGIFQIFGTDKFCWIKKMDLRWRCVFHRQA